MLNMRRDDSASLNFIVSAVLWLLVGVSMGLVLAIPLAILCAVKSGTGIDRFLTGLAFAPIFPTIVGVTFAKFDASQYGSIFGIIFAIGLLVFGLASRWFRS